MWLDFADAHYTFVAALAGQADAAQARLLSARAYVFQDFGENKRAMDEFHRAVEAYVQLEGEYSQYASYMWVSIAAVAQSERELQRALDALDQAGRIREAIFGIHHPKSYEVELDRAQILQEFAPERVDEIYQPLLERVEQTHGVDGVRTAYVASQWGNSLRERQGCAAARPTLERAVAILAAKPRDDTAWKSSAYLNAAACRLEAGEVMSARAAAVVAQDLLGKVPDADASAKAQELIDACDRALAADPRSDSRGSPR